MRAKLIFSLSALVGFALLGSPAFAQEDGQSNAEIQELNSHQELNLNDDKTLIMDVDTKASKVSPIVVRDTPPATQSSSKKQEAQKPSGSSTDKAQEDPLSFNFLYFIIQKFKISDIID